jgi:hypothetical protein
MVVTFVLLPAAYVNEPAKVVAWLPALKNPVTPCVDGLRS